MAIIPAQQKLGCRASHTQPAAVADRLSAAASFLQGRVSSSPNPASKNRQKYQRVRLHRRSLEGKKRRVCTGVTLQMQIEHELGVVPLRSRPSKHFGFFRLSLRQPGTSWWPASSWFAMRELLSLLMLGHLSKRNSPRLPQFAENASENRCFNVMKNCGGMREVRRPCAAIATWPSHVVLGRVRFLLDQAPWFLRGRASFRSKPPPEP